MANDVNDSGFGPADHSPALPAFTAGHPPPRGLAEIQKDVRLHRPPKNRQGLRIKFSPIPHLPESIKHLKNPLWLQNAPLDQFEREHANAAEKYMTLHDGEYSRRQGRSLVVASFTTLAVMIPYPWVVNPNAGFDIDAITRRLVTIADGGLPFWFLATFSWNKSKPVMHIKARIESLRVIDKGGESDARYFDIAISEWRDPVVTSKGRGRGGTAWPKYVILDRHGKYHWPWKAKTNKPLTLSLIAKQAYGKPSLWKRIAHMNYISGWGPNDPLIKSPTYRNKGGRIEVPPPTGALRPGWHTDTSSPQGTGTTTAFVGQG